MEYPSGMRLPSGQKFEVVRIDKGLYCVTNAYAGLYEYFEDRPIPVETESIATPIVVEGADALSAGEESAALGRTLDFAPADRLPGANQSFERHEP